ncbi:MAG: HD domain-containing protein [Anaerolineae bacterium]|nr:HD domain-containing protein [Anaerolineae bacterium]
MHFGGNAHQAETAGWLHDISAIVPAAQRIEYTQQWGIAVFPEEAAAPMLLHQRQSAVLAAELFGVSDAAVLSAIGCHTTLKASPTTLDKIVFLADKVAWDGVAARHLIRTRSCGRSRCRWMRRAGATSTISGCAALLCSPSIRGSWRLITSFLITWEGE